MGATKSFLVVDTDESTLKNLEAGLRSLEPEAHIFHAKDGNEALFKLQNAVPSLVLTGMELHKHFSGRKLIEEILNEKRLAQTSIIVTDSPPDKEFCLEEVIAGRIQFLRRPFDISGLSRALNRAMRKGSSGTAESEFRLKTIAAGELLLKEGDEALCTYLVKSGKLQAFHRREGEKKILGEIKPGEFAGEMGCLMGEPRSADVEALEPSELIKIPLAALDALIFTKPAWAKAITKTLSLRLKSAAGQD